MKNQVKQLLIALALVATLNLQLSTAFAQGTAFTYQGQLQNNGSPASGSYNLTFSLFNINAGSSPIAGPVTTNGVLVTNGLFTVTIDFGSAVFTGATNWLQIGVATNGVSSFTPLSPRQELTPAPYAIYADSASAAGLSGTIANASLPASPVFSGTVTAGSFSGNGSGLTSLNGASLVAGTVGTTQLANGALDAPVSIAGTSAVAVPNTGYVATNASTTTITLPTTANVGDIVQVNGPGTGGWQILGDFADTQGFVWTTTQTPAPSTNWQCLASSADGTHLVAVINGGQIYTAANSVLDWTAQTGAPSANWQSIASSADGAHLVAVINGGQIYTSANSGTNWTAQSSAPSTNWQCVASSADGTHLVAVGGGPAGGEVYTSPDSGVTWTEQIGAFPTPLTSVASSSDGTHLVAVGTSFIYTSVNSGVTWTPTESLSVGPWRSVASSSDGTRLVAVGGGDGGWIYTSADSGVTWTVPYGSPDEYWTSVASSSDGSHLVAVGYGSSIYTSADGGFSWTAQSNAPSANWQSVASSVDGTHLVAAMNGGQIYTSANRGTSWTLIGANWQCLASSADGTHLVAVNSPGGIYTSANSGTNWTAQAGAPSTNWQSIASSADGTHLVAVINGGQIYTSANSGASWTAQSSAPSTNWQCVASSSDGTHLVAVYGEFMSNSDCDIIISGGIYTSANSGVTWAAQSNAPSVNWQSVASSADGTHLVATYGDFVSNSICTAASGGIYTSANSGTNWTYSAPVLGRSVASSADGSHLVAVSTGGVYDFSILPSQIYTSTDGGVNWTAQSNAPSANWRSVASSSDGTHLVAVGSSPAGSEIYTSADGGVNWTAQSSAPSTNWQCVASSADGTHLVAGINDGPIYTAVETIIGSQGSSEQFQYIGSGYWLPVEANGPIADASLPVAVVTNTETGVTLGGTFSGDGSALTSLNAAQLTGTIPNGALPSSPSFSGTVTAGSFSGAGSALTSLTAANLTGGPLPTLNGANLTSLNAAQLTSVGNNNFFVGPSGNAANTGSANTALGVQALANITTGGENTACGYQVLFNNLVGFYNSAYGVQALFNNTNGYENIASGYRALYNNLSGSYNEAYGDSALFSNTNGNYNVANGYLALQNLSSGGGNIGLGTSAGQNLTTGNNNIYIGNSGAGTGFSSTENNIIRIGTQGTQTATYLAGTVYANGVALTSDRDAKENFTAVNARGVLAKVASLPVTEWNYKTDRKEVQHIGPMAQDFQAAFGLDGTDDKHISLVDEGGVALAAIQGLNQKLQEELNRQDAENAKLKQQNDLLAERLNELEATVKQLAANK